jgi:hypothetical protein
MIRSQRILVFAKQDEEVAVSITTFFDPPLTTYFDPPG